MTRQEKWIMTIRCMELVRSNYHLLHGNAPSMRHARQIHTIMKWKAAIDDACKALRERKGKSAARARHDWLVARMLMLMVYEAEDSGAIRRSLSPGKTVHQRYADALSESAVMAVLESAEKLGLL